MEELLYHALACGEEEKAARWGGMLVNYFRESLAFAESMRVGEWVLAEKKQPPANEFDAALLNATGNTFLNMGDNHKAIEYFDQQLEILKKCFGEKHQNTATTLNNLGGAWDALGDNRKAIEYFEQALKIFKEIYGEKHPDVAVGLTNLGLSWKALGDIGKAIEYFEQALKIFKE
ncbi:MAG: tetratricopeptide repeat protein, partial [bacterium]|nr:tetratricopeptide repeat protein [bacterium]